MDRAQLLNDNEEAFRLAFEGRQVGMWTALPGIVTAVDFATSTCTVQPALTASIEDENENVVPVNLPLLVNVPIVFPGVNGFVLTLPLVIGDEVLVVFASRCIDSWWQSGGIQAPMESRMHDLSDGFAFPANMSQAKKISNISATTAQLRNRAGTAYIELTATGVNIHGNVVVTGDVVADGISLKTHHHTLSVASTPFSGSTGGPT